MEQAHFSYDHFSYHLDSLGQRLRGMWPCLNFLFLLLLSCPHIISQLEGLILKAGSWKTYTPIAHTHSHCTESRVMPLCKPLLCLCTKTTRKFLHSSVFTNVQWAFLDFPLWTPLSFSHHPAEGRFPQVCSCLTLGSPNTEAKTKSCMEITLRGWAKSRGREVGMEEEKQATVSS